jgi:hypothetical protein
MVAESSEPQLSQLLITIRGFTEVYEEIIKEPEGKFYMLKIRT